MKTIEPRKGSVFTYPIPLWADQDGCPECRGYDIFALNLPHKG